MTISRSPGKPLGFQITLSCFLFNYLNCFLFLKFVCIEYVNCILAEFKILLQNTIDLQFYHINLILKMWEADKQ